MEVVAATEGEEIPLEEVMSLVDKNQIVWFLKGCSGGDQIEQVGPREARESAIEISKGENQEEISDLDGRVLMGRAKSRVCWE